MPGFLDDYAFYVQALIDLYENGVDVRRLKLALEVQRKQDELFRDAGDGDANTNADANGSATAVLPHHRHRRQRAAAAQGRRGRGRAVG